MVYKYLPPSCLEPLKDCTLKFSLSTDLNDPFENLNRVVIEDNSKLTEMLEKIKDAVGNEELFGRLEPLLTGNGNSSLYLALQEESKARLDKQLGILSLSRNCSNSLMWSHYSQKHEGYVIGFDESHSWFDQFEHDWIGVLRDVHYSQKRPTYNTKNKLTESNLYEPYFTKSADWGYENETRMVLPLEHCDNISDNLFVKRFPYSLIKEVIFGFHTSNEFQEFAITTVGAKNPDVKFYRCAPSSIDYNLQIEAL